MPSKPKCCKCGSKDVHTEHSRAGEFHRHMSMMHPDRLESRFIRNDSLGFVTMIECLLHACRTCRFHWETQTQDAAKGTPNAE